MKISRLIVLVLIGMFLAFGLVGCKITGASPDPGTVIEMKPGDKVLFKVTGPANTLTTKCVWTITRKNLNFYDYEEVVSEGKNEFELDFNSDSKLSNKKNIITCAYKSYRYTHGPCGPICDWSWQWVTTDYRKWEIRTNPNSATVITGDYIIENDSDLQLLNGYTTVTGSLIIGPSIKSLEGLENLTTIVGSLGISRNNYIKNLTALENLTSVGGDLYIGGNLGNDALTSLSGLENITSVGGDLAIRYNKALTSLSGLDNITSVNGTLWVAGNRALISFSGLENLTTVGGDLDIYDNNALTNLSALENMTSVGGDFHISSNPVLTSLSGLENITSVGGHLYIESNEALTALGMTGLQKVGGFFSIISNPMLCSSLAIELKNQVLLRKGIWGIIDISGNKDCTGL